MKSQIFMYLRDRWPFSHAVQVNDIEKLVQLSGAEPWHIYAIKSRIWRRHVCIACNWVSDCTSPHELVFEPGCGSGANLLWLAQKKGFTHLSGSDRSPEAVRLSHMLATQSGTNINVIEDDSLCPNHLPSNVATILSVNWLYHIPGATMSNFLAIHRHCLKNRGRVVCDIIDAAYNNQADNQYHSDDLHLPPSQRRPTRYLFRHSPHEMQQIAQDNGFRILRSTRMHASIPRAVYMLEKI